VRWQVGRILDRSAYLGRMPRGLARRRIRLFWEGYAARIHAEWGHDHDDYSVLADILRRHGVHSVLDVGCGSGRLFPLYRDAGVGQVLGVDLAAEALALAAHTFPDVPTRRLAVEDLPADLGHWDLVVSNRVLQHVPAQAIAGVVERIAGLGRLVYVNELSDTDDLNEEFFMTRHDYRRLFDAAGLEPIDEGRLGAQTWLLFGAVAAGGAP
jgi:SAM-dependent methyltransferase